MWTAKNQILYCGSSLKLAEWNLFEMFVLLLNMKLLERVLEQNYQYNKNISVMNEHLTASFMAI